MNGKSITENSVLMRLEFNRLGAVRKGNLALVESDADKKRLKLGKVLFVSKEFEAIASADNDLGAWVRNRALSVSMGFRGVSILPLALLPDVERRFAEHAEKRAALVSAFMGVYDAEKARAAERLGSQFNAADYPPADAARAAFGFSWSYVSLAAPESLPPELRERENEKLRAKLESAGDEIRAALREGLADLVAHLADKLTVGPDGKAKVFRDSTVGNLVEFLDLIEARDITADDALRELCEKARKVVGPIASEPDKARKSYSLRESIRAGLAEVSTAAAALVSEVKGRAFDLSEE